MHGTSIPYYICTTSAKPILLRWRGQYYCVGEGSTTALAKPMNRILTITLKSFIRMAVLPLPCRHTAPYHYPTGMDRLFALWHDGTFVRLVDMALRLPEEPGAQDFHRADHPPVQHTLFGRAVETDQHFVRQPGRSHRQDRLDRNQLSETELSRMEAKEMESNPYWKLLQEIKELIKTIRQ